MANTAECPIVGSPDDLKLCSSMTLFALFPGTDLVFEVVLNNFLNGVKDKTTLQRLKNYKLNYLFFYNIARLVNIPIANISEKLKLA